MIRTRSTERVSKEEVLRNMSTKKVKTGKIIHRLSPGKVTNKSITAKNLIVPMMPRGFSSLEREKIRKRECRVLSVLKEK